MKSAGSRPLPVHGEFSSSLEFVANCGDVGLGAAQSERWIDVLDDEGEAVQWREIRPHMKADAHALLERPTAPPLELTNHLRSVSLPEPRLNFSQLAGRAVRLFFRFREVDEDVTAPVALDARDLGDDPCTGNRLDSFGYPGKVLMQRRAVRFVFEWVRYHVSRLASDQDAPHAARARRRASLSGSCICMRAFDLLSLRHI